MELPAVIASFQIHKLLAMECFQFALSLLFRHLCTQNPTISVSHAKSILFYQNGIKKFFISPSITHLGTQYGLDSYT